MNVSSDEEEEITINTFIFSRLQDLQNEVEELKDKTALRDIQATNENFQQESRSKTTNNEILQEGINDLRDKIDALEEAKADLQDAVRDLKQELRNQAATLAELFQDDTLPSSNPARSSGGISSFLQRSITSHDGLPADTFTLMMTSPLCSKAWLLGIFAFIFQMVLIALILYNQLQEAVASSVFNIPFKVDPVVRTGQFFTIIFALATQNDITSSIRLIVMFWSDPGWSKMIPQREEGAPPPTNAEWLIHIILPNILKFLQGSLVMVVTFVVIVQSDNIIDLLKDFTALMVLSETDNIFFLLAINGYLGSELQRKAIQARRIKILYEASESDDIENIDAAQISSINNRDFGTRPIILFSIAMAMIGGWAYVVSNQVNGKYFLQRYEKCNVTNAFQLAKKHFGDGVCYGGPLNTLGCEFEGGDCVNFNLAFPLCKGEDRIDVQNSLGNGSCEKIFMNADCDYDGGDCCPYDIIKDPTFGDGQCNAGRAYTEGCGYDSGDCNRFRLSFPDCPLDDLSQIDGAGEVVIGDDICDSGIYNMKDCGYEFGDCRHGQVGQTVLITEEVERNNQLYFGKTLSSDGTTMALGLQFATKDGSSFDYSSSGGLAKILRYDTIRKMWQQLGSDIWLSSSGVIYLSCSKNRIAISTSDLEQVSIYEFNATSGDAWNQVGQTISTTEVSYLNAMAITADGSRVALRHSWNEIRIYDLKPSSRRQEWVNDDRSIINPGDDLSFNTPHLKFNSLNGSRLLISDKTYADAVTKVFQFDPDSASTLWTQMGQDLESTYSASSAISADGNRIAIPTSATLNAPGQVEVLDYDAVNNVWVPVGEPIKSSSSSGYGDDGSGYSIHLSSNGTLLVIASNSPGCQISPNVFDIDECTTGSVMIYNYHEISNKFGTVPPKTSPLYNTANGNILDLADLSNSAIFGLHFSLNEDSTVLSMSGYNADKRNAFIEAYDLEEFFYTKCVVDIPSAIGDGYCDDYPPYNSEECGYDGGDCEQNPVEDYPGCIVNYPDDIGNGDCHDSAPYNTVECGFDGGDCILTPVDGYPKCLIFRGQHDQIGDGWCNDNPPYNSEDCGFDGGDCDPKPVEDYPDCIIHSYYHYYIGNGDCDYSYNTEECGFDGGDCQ